MIVDFPGVGGSLDADFLLARAAWAMDFLRLQLYAINLFENSVVRRASAVFFADLLRARAAWTGFFRHSIARYKFIRELKCTS